MAIIPQAAPAGALCAIHTERSADAVCTRCGSFMCSECSENRIQEHCPSCRTNIGAFPFSRNDFDFGRVWSYAFERWRGDLVQLGLCGLVFTVMSGAGSLVSNIFTQPGALLIQKGGQNAIVTGGALMGLGLVVATVANIFVQGIGLMGLMRVVIDALQGKKVEFNRMFSQMKRLKSYALLQLVIIGAIVVPFVLIGGVVGVMIISSKTSPERWVETAGPLLGLGVLVFGVAVLVLMIFLLPLTFSTWEIVYGGAGAIESIRRSWLLGSGFRAETLGYSLVAGLASGGIVVAGLLALCVGVVVAIPIAIALQHAVVGALYLALRTNSGLPPPPES